MRTKGSSRPEKPKFYYSRLWGEELPATNIRAIQRNLVREGYPLRSEATPERVAEALDTFHQHYADLVGKSSDLVRVEQGIYDLIARFADEHK